MSESKFTPGPWYARRNTAFWEINAEGFGQIGDACASTASIADGHGSEELGRANATLMAAAPELFEAVRRMLPYFEGEHAYDHPCSVQARAALAKASPEQSDV